MPESDVRIKATNFEKNPTVKYSSEIGYWRKESAQFFIVGEN